MGGDTFGELFDVTGGGDAARVKGFSENVNERQQRLQEARSIASAATDLDLRAILNQFISGQPFQQGFLENSGRHIVGNFETQPTGPAFNIVAQGLEGEELLSQLRQQIAQNQLGFIPENQQLTQAFGQQATEQGIQSLQAQNALLGSQLGTFQDTNRLNQTAADQLRQFFESGGAPNQFQTESIGNIFDAQRQIGQSNLQQQFGQALRDLQDQATTRGLRFGDTPIQDRGGLLAQEFARNTTNLETALSGQQADALLNTPFRQASLAGATQGQTQNQLLNILNAFSSPISQGFNSGNQLTQANQFGLQFSPAAFSGASLQNLGALTGQFAPTQTTPVFTGGVVLPTRPTGGDTLGQAFTQSFGSELGTAAGQGVKSGFGGGGGGGGAGGGGLGGF